MAMKNDIENYIKRIKKQLFYGTKESRTFIKELRENIYDYADHYEVNSFDEIVRQFGTEQEIATTFFQQYDKVKLRKKIRLRKNVTMSIVILIAVFMCLIGLFALHEIETDKTYAIEFPLKIIEESTMEEAVSFGEEST